MKKKTKVRVIKGEEISNQNISEIEKCEKKLDLYMLKVNRLEEEKMEMEKNVEEAFKILWEIYIGIMTMRSGREINEIALNVWREEMRKGLGILNPDQNFDIY